MHVCYFDEAGDTRAVPTVDAEIAIPRLFVFGGVSLNARDLRKINDESIAVKAAYFDGANVRHDHDYLKQIAPEIKGSELRRRIGDAKAEAALDSMLQICRDYDVKVLARVHVKVPGTESKGEAIYNRAVELSCIRFHERLEAIDHQGMVVADNRELVPNEAAAHSIHDEKFLGPHDKLPRIADIPTFGQSQNHIGLQLADLICSALIYPIARARLLGDTQRDDAFVDRFAPQLEELQARYVDTPAKTLDGVWVGDLNGKPISRSKLFA